MDLPRGVEGYIKETTNHEIRITMDAPQKKLFAAQGSQLRLYVQYMSTVSRLKEKDQVIDLVRSEASTNAQALEKFAEENQTLRGEYDDLVNQCEDLRRRCSLYHLDLEASMRSRNETEERARDAESRVKESDEELRRMSSVIKEEENQVDSVLATIVSEEETKYGRMLLEENIQDPSFQAWLSRWDQLKPSMRKAIYLVSMVISMEKEKKFLTVKVDRAEQELELAREQNREVRKENRKLSKQWSRSHLCAERSSNKKRKEKEA